MTKPARITASTIMKPYSLIPAQAWTEEIRLGISTAAVRAFIERSGLDRTSLLHALGISQRTLERRAGSRLDAAQSDRFFRVKRIYDFAVEVLGDEENASGWLQDRVPALGGERPIDLLETEIGAHTVRSVLGRIMYGMFS